MSPLYYIDRPKPPPGLKRRRKKHWHSNLARRVRLSRRRQYGWHLTWITLGQIANGRQIE